MPRKPDPDPDPDAMALFAEPVTHGRHAAAGDRALAAAQDKGLLANEDEALATIIRAGMFALDRAELSAKPYYPIAQLITPIRDALDSARMTPSTREAAADNELERLLRELGTPSPAEARDPAESGS
ncbi:hypothetical protein [Tomitella biformata]|uniref:hypothetical protein n=1 Tax=Tomitella biformata TaxID=630403 RepID=UPI00046486C0|nr:hypothetical protein [Tomitella biformata]